MNAKASRVLACLAVLVACADGAETTPNDGAGAYEAGLPVAASVDARTRGDSNVHRDDARGSKSCARASVGLTRVVPTVQVVVDASGSMAEPLGDCATRWDCLRGALIGDEGLITKLQSTVSFGLTLFGGQIAKIEDGKVVEVINSVCPRILNVDPALENRDNIARRYELANPGGGTPTAEALRFVIDALPSPAEQIESAVGPQIILLVTDGDPNECSDPVATTYGPTEAQALRAQQKGIQLFALTVASDQNRAHLQRMANLGAGLPADASPGAPYFEPSRAEELSESLRRIVGDAVSCEVQLEGTVSVKRAGDECEGTVILNSTPVECNGADGWRLEGARTLVLQGAACERFKFDPSVQLSANFPCELVTLL
jgi:hypothetical protein